MNFFITGLPRSRTAWMANLFTYGDVHCFHEGMSGCESVVQYQTKLDSMKYHRHVGDSNTTTALFMSETWGPTVIIERDLDEVVASLEDMQKEYGKEIFGTSKEIRQNMEALWARLQVMEGLHIPFDQVDSRLEEIWEYCLPVPFNEERAEMLKDFKIEITQQRLDTLVKEISIWQ